MSMHEVAKHLSAMGRHGDTMLVHMSPAEVKALHGIGSLTGSEITINPETGLPEAFSFGDFFKSMLPTIVGAVAAPLTGGTSMLIPVMAGAATGAALNSDNPLMGALTGGLGGFGGANIGSALANAGKTGALTGATSAGAGSGGMGITATGGINPAYANAAGTAVSEAALPTAAAQGTTTYFGPATSGAVSAAGKAAPTFGEMGQGIANLGTGSGRDAFVQSLGGTGPNADLIAAGKVAMPVGMSALSAIEPPTMPQEKEEKYDPYATLNLSGDSGLRFFAGGGTVYESPDPGSDPRESAGQTLQYGIGGLSRYARGGDVGLFGGSSLSLADEPEPTVNKRNRLNANPLYILNPLMKDRNNQQTDYRPQSGNPFLNAFGMNRFMRMPPPPPPPLLSRDSGARFARGGYLDGPGDGMSDSIPATIEGKQPAKLADGEFVVPADVVSHLGNGSTKAGAQRLYAMMDKVRKARTGTKQQGKQIKAEKYLPA